MPVAAGNEITTTAVQQSIFGAPPSSLPAPVTAQAPSAKPVQDQHMDGDAEDDGPKGVKRTREDESDDEGAPMEEDSDAPMEDSSDEDDG